MLRPYKTSLFAVTVLAESRTEGDEVKDTISVDAGKICNGGEISGIRNFYNTRDIVASEAPAPVPILAAPPRSTFRSEHNKLINALVKAGMSKENAQKLVSHIIQNIKQRYPGAEGEKRIRLITGEPSLSKQGKLATTWAKIKAKH